MTRPAKSVLHKHSKTCALVLDGNEVKARLVAERNRSAVPVHVDWLRFTVLLRNAPLPGVETLFPLPVADDAEESMTMHQRCEHGMRIARLRKLLAKLPDADFSPSSQALELAERVCEVLGPEFVVAVELRKGHDFYRHRWSIERNGQECGWVGFLASGDSPRQQAQAKTMHVNLYGSACTFAQHGWRDHMANLVDHLGGTITRCDLALDFFNGLKGGMARVLADYQAGLCDVGGKRPNCNMVGDWTEGGRKGRSFYIGSKEAGKQTNVYEKGAQLFGEQDATNWMRVELRYGNKLRHLPSDMLRRPSDFFAGASDWHAQLLREAGAIAPPQAVHCTRELVAQTVEAEVTRVIRWATTTAGQTLALFFKYCTTEQFAAVVEHRALPARLRRFSTNEIARAFSGAANRVLKGAGAGHAMA